MCPSLVEIRSVISEIRRRKKDKSTAVKCKPSASCGLTSSGSRVIATGNRYPFLKLVMLQITTLWCHEQARLRYHSPRLGQSRQKRLAAVTLNSLLNAERMRNAHVTGQWQRQVGVRYMEWWLTEHCARTAGRPSSRCNRAPSTRCSSGDKLPVIKARRGSRTDVCFTTWSAGNRETRDDRRPTRTTVVRHHDAVLRPTNVRERRVCHSACTPNVTPPLPRGPVTALIRNNNNNNNHAMCRVWFESIQLLRLRTCVKNVRIFRPHSLHVIGMNGAGGNLNLALF